MIPRHLKIMAGVLMAVAVALVFYTWSLKHNAESTQKAETLPVGPPVYGQVGQAVFYLANDATGELTRRTVTIPLPEEKTERTAQILRNLLANYLSHGSAHTIGEGSDVGTVFLVNNTLAIVSFNSAFADKHPSGVLSEELTVASVVATLRANNAQIEKVKILIDGKERETLAGHADLKNPLDAITLTQTVKDLQ